MDITNYFKEKLATVMFLELKPERIEALFKIPVEEEIYFPLRAERMNLLVMEGNSESIPLSFFIEGFFYVLGADSKFKYNLIYKDIIFKNDKFIDYIKGLIASEIKNNNYEDAYIFLKGVLEIEPSEENYRKYFLLADELRHNASAYIEDILLVLEKAYKISNFPDPYYYEALIMKEQSDFTKALYCINNYFKLGGTLTKETSELRSALKDIRSYEHGKEILYEDPKSALELLLPLSSPFGDDPILMYYIALAYRILNQNSIALEYLQQAFALDNQLVEVVNELGINYAAVGDYERAILYLRKAFEATKAIEICTNLIMCYINIGDLKQAKLHLSIAEKLKSDDEIVQQLKEILSNNF